MHGDNPAILNAMYVILLLWNNAPIRISNVNNRISSDIRSNNCLCNCVCDIYGFVTDIYIYIYVTMDVDNTKVYLGTINVQYNI